MYFVVFLKQTSWRTYGDASKISKMTQKMTQVPICGVPTLTQQHGVIYPFSEMFAYLWCWCHLPPKGVIYNGGSNLLKKKEDVTDSYLATQKKPM